MADEGKDPEQDDDNKDPSSPSSLEDAFRMIEQGNRRHDQKDYWKAADVYSQAQRILEKLGQVNDDDNNSSSSEEKKVANLCRQQARNYLERARKSLLEALQRDIDDEQEKEIGSSRSSSEPAQQQTEDFLLQRLSDEDCAYRLQLFGRLFAKELLDEDPKTVDEQQSTLEDRLNNLNSSFPTVCKTEKERLQDLNRGLHRLGLSGTNDEAEAAERRNRLLQMWKSEHSSNNVQSEVEQVEDIINQAKDEVALSGGVNTDMDLAEAAAAGKELTADDIPDADKVVLDDDFDVDEDEEDVLSTDDDGVLTPDFCRNVNEELVRAQVSLAELIALFEVDEDENAEVEFDQARGKHLLKDARRILQKVAVDWASR